MSDDDELSVDEESDAHSSRRSVTKREHADGEDEYLHTSNEHRPDVAESPSAPSPVKSDIAASPTIEPARKKPSRILTRSRATLRSEMVWLSSSKMTLCGIPASCSALRERTQGLPTDQPRRAFSTRPVLPQTRPPLIQARSVKCMRMTHNHLQSGTQRYVSSPAHRRSGMILARMSLVCSGFGRCTETVPATSTRQQGSSCKR